MRIGVDACCWSNLRGFGRFTRELLTALLKIDRTNQYIFFVDQQTAGSSQFPENASTVVVQTSVAPTEAASATGRRSISDLWSMSRAVMKVPFDLFFFPAIYSYFPIFNRAKIAVTIHDMIPAAFPASVFPSRKLEYFWNLKEKAALWQADRIVTVSDYSRKQIVKLRGVPEEKIGIVSEGPGESFQLLPAGEERRKILSRFGLQPEERFLLYVGGISPHKNLRSLVKVFCKLASSLPGCKLVLAGDYEKDSFFSDFSELSELAKNLQMKDHVVFTGYVSDTELAHLYNSAALFVLPSLQEGFGLSAVEAMACGTPIVASRAGSLPEIVGDAAELFDPENLDEMLQVITRALQDQTLRQNLRERGLKRAALFQWSRGATELLNIFNGMERR